MAVAVELLLILVLQLMVFLWEEPVEVEMEQVIVNQQLGIAEQTVLAVAEVVVHLSFLQLRAVKVATVEMV